MQTLQDFPHAKIIKVNNTDIQIKGWYLDILILYFDCAFPASYLNKWKEGRLTSSRCAYLFIFGCFRMFILNYKYHADVIIAKYVT